MLSSDALACTSASMVAGCAGVGCAAIVNACIWMADRSMSASGSLRCQLLWHLAVTVTGSEVWPVVWTVGCIYVSSTVRESVCKVESCLAESKSCEMREIRGGLLQRTFPFRAVSLSVTSGPIIAHTLSLCGVEAFRCSEGTQGPVMSRWGQYSDTVALEQCRGWLYWRAIHAIWLYRLPS